MVSEPRDLMALDLRRHTSMTGERFDGVLAAHDAEVRHDERSRVAGEIAGRIERLKPERGDELFEYGWERAQAEFARIAREAGSSE